MATGDGRVRRERFRSPFTSDRRVTGPTTPVGRGVRRPTGLPPRPSGWLAECAHMTEQPQRPQVDLSRRRLLSVAFTTVVGVAVFVIAMVTTEPNWMMWFFGILMMVSALAFWVTYALYRIRQRGTGR